MKEEIGKHEDMKLCERIILNGVVDYCNTGDDNDRTIGVKDIKKIKTLSGEVLTTTSNGFPLTKEMESRIGWGSKYASVRFVTGKTPIENFEEAIIESIFGVAKAEYQHRYSDYTGYLWTDEGFTVGGHDLRKILQSHLGEYIHMEIELYTKK